jgi:hypothetical protein
LEPSDPLKRRTMQCTAAALLLHLPHRRPVRLVHQDCPLQVRGQLARSAPLTLRRIAAIDERIDIIANAISIHVNSFKSRAAFKLGDRARFFLAIRLWRKHAAPSAIAHRTTPARGTNLFM